LISRLIIEESRPAGSDGDFPGIGRDPPRL
jgi:hypothetical protein